MEMQAKPILLSTKDAQELLGVSSRTLRDWRKEGLPHIMIGNQPRFFEESIIEWVKARQVTMGAE